MSVVTGGVVPARYGDPLMRVYIINAEDLIVTREASARARTRSLILGRHGVSKTLR